MSYRGGNRGPMPNRGNNHGGKGRNHNNNNNNNRQPQRQSDFLVPMLPFDTLERGVQEHKARNPHRRYFSDAITSIAADWAKTGKGHLAEAMHQVLDIQVGGAPVFEVPATATEEEGKVNVRAFIACGINPPQEAAQQCKHVLRRIDLVGSSMSTDTRQLASYGGLVAYDGQGDEYLVGELKKVLLAQAGMDLSGVQTWTRLCTIHYATKCPTIFFFPHLTSLAELSMSPLCRKVEEQYEETVEEEAEEEPAKETTEATEDADGEEGVTDGDKVEEKKAPVKKVVQKTRTVEQKVMYPTKTPLGTLHEASLGKSTHSDTVELCTASDVFDEWLKHDFASEINDFLTGKQDEAKAKIASLKQKMSEANTRKRKREEQITACKRRKEEKITSLRQQWDDEDVGKTDEDKNECEAPRKAALRELDAEESRELKEGEEETQVEVQEQKNTIGVRDQRQYDLFQFFDRSKGLAPTSNTLSRDWLAQTILCLNKGLTYGEALQLTTMNGLYTKASALDYNALTTEEREKPEEEEVIADPADEQVEAEAVNGDEVVADEVMQDDAAEPAEEE